MPQVDRPFPRDAWSVQVLKRDMFEKPVVDIDDAYKVVVRNRDGVPAMALVRVNGTAWAFSMATDDDWPSVCKQYGIS